MGECYDTTLECIDWRYSAAMVGLKQYFDFSNKKYGKIAYQENKDSISYYQKDIYEERFLAFAEDFFWNDMFHTVVDDMIRDTEEFTKEQIDLVNAKLTGNTVMKNVFGKVKFDGQNKELILELIHSNRNQIIRETFRNKKNLYANYCNTNLLLSPSQPHCRLLGYNLDEGRKSKSAAYNFNASTFVSTDRIEFDFIPFSFTNSYEAIFINNNWSFKELCKSNESIARLVTEEKNNERRNSARAILFKTIMETSDYLDYDIEVILKSRDKDYYETLFVRKKAIHILKELKSTKTLWVSFKVNENYYIDIQREAIECILNEVSTDRLIEMLLKSDIHYRFTIDKLIEINHRLKGFYEENGAEKMKSILGYTRKCAEEVVKALEKNKVKSYRQKLISAIVAEDYDRYCEILLQLSAYSGVTFGFCYDLFEDFEKNKDIAYTFVAALDINQNQQVNNNNQ